MVPVYGREALRRLRAQQAADQEPERQPSLLEQIPADAPMDDATLTVWDGNRFVAYDKWLATAPVAIEARPGSEAPGAPADASCVAGDCSGTRVWLVRDGDRWLMFAGSRSARGRRRDFASPFLAHAMRTAEQWYGAPADGWHASEIREAANGQ
jgi:hypothetical protein